MDRQLQHMVRLVDDLLDVSRITRGKVGLRKERIELAQVIQSAVETSNPLIEASGHELVIRLAPEPIWLEADHTRLAQVVSNLLNNSARYTKPHGRICLTTEKREKERSFTSATTELAFRKICCRTFLTYLPRWIALWNTLRGAWASG